MIHKKKIYLAVFLFSILMQGVSVLQYFWTVSEEYGFDWVSQYSVLVGCSILLTACQYFIKSSRIRLFIFLIRFLMLGVVHLPVNIYIGLKQMLLIAFLLDLSFFISFPLNSLMAVLSFLSIYSLSALSRYKAREIPFPELHDFLYIGLFTSITIFIFSSFKYFFDSYREHQDEIRRLNQTIKKLTDANSGFQHYIRIVEKKSSEDERNRIIREIHDSIGYTLTTVMMLATSVLESDKNSIAGKYKGTFSSIRNSARSGLNDMRIVLRLLKVKKDNTESDLLQLNRMVRAFEKATDIQVRLEFGNAPNFFREDISHLVFRLIQEGMINALRHGNAKEMDIFLAVQDKNLIITISDNGKGFKDMIPGIGLKGMQERLEAIEGRLTISNSRSGVTLHITIPMKEVRDNEQD